MLVCAVSFQYDCVCVGVCVSVYTRTLVQSLLYVFLKSFVPLLMIISRFCHCLHFTSYIVITL